MLQWTPLALILLLATAAGCGRPACSPQDAHAPVLGEVDAYLPPDVQTKQMVLKSFFDGLCKGISLDRLCRQDPNLRFDESLEEFLEPGAIGLGGWQFLGKPDGDDVPVVLYFNLDGTGRNQLKVERVYTVTDTGGRLTISRNRWAARTLKGRCQ
jgi:hypothetical protein